MDNLIIMKTNPIVKEITIPSDLNTVWEAITNPEKMKEWYFEVNDFRLEKDNEFYFYEPGSAQKYRHLCKIIDIIPNRKFKHTWTFPDYSSGISTLTWELTEHEGNTHVKLTHEGVENFANAGNDFTRKSFDAGWEEIVTQNLVNYLIQ